MGSMPNWFAKTKEMAAFDHYFSTRDVSEKELLDRYRKALSRMPRNDFYRRADALDVEWSGVVNSNLQKSMSLDKHFRGDWIHHLYPDDPATYGSVGGRFWPKVPSTKVIDELRFGVIAAIHKAMGETELINLGVPQHHRDWLWTPERENGIDVDDGIRGIALSWNCVAPAGDNYFEAEALRGPTVVEFAIATPRPIGHSTLTPLVDELDAGRIEMESLVGGTASES
jgi:hypothetical protein